MASKATAKQQTRKPRQPKVYADEQLIEAQITAIQEKAKGRDKTDAEKTELSTLRSKLGGLRFVRLAEFRVPKALAAIGQLAKLGTPQYTRTDEDCAAIVNTLQKAVDAVKERFAGTKAVATAFKLR